MHARDRVIGGGGILFLEHRVDDDRPQTRSNASPDHPNVSRASKFFREHNRHSPINRSKRRPSPMFIGTGPKKGKKREGGREVFSFRPNAVNFNDDILLHLVLVTLCGSRPSGYLLREILIRNATFALYWGERERGKFIREGNRDL